MHGSKRKAREVQAPSRKKDYANETPQQQERHREIAQRYGRKKRSRRPPGNLAFIIGDLQAFFGAVYGATMPHDDPRALDSLIVLLHHVVDLGTPRALRACAARWAPWLTDAEYGAMIAEIECRPLRWRADSLAHRIGLNDAVRTLLKIKNIGANDITKAQRIARGKKRNTEAHKARRAAAGAASQATSAERLKPWLALGMSRATYYRNRKNETGETDSSAITYLIDVGRTSLKQGAPRARARRRGEKEFKAARVDRLNASNRLH